MVVNGKLGNIGEAIFENRPGTTGQAYLECESILGHKDKAVGKISDDSQEAVIISQMLIQSIDEEANTGRL
jgi:hypothetical protein